MGKVKGLLMDKQEELYTRAYNTVVAVRGSNDAPGFDLCVAAEYELLCKEEGINA